MSFWGRSSGGSASGSSRYSRTDERGLVIELTVAEFGERFFREIVKRDRMDTTIPRRYFDKSIVPAIGSKPVREVTTEDVRAIIWRKKDEGFDAAAGVIRGALKRLFDYAMTAGLTATNPVMAVPMRHVHVRARATGRWRRRRSACS